jgi:hypothetical protein
MITLNEHKRMINGLFDYTDQSGTVHEIQYAAILNSDGPDSVTAEPVEMWDGWDDCWEDVEEKALEHAYKEANNVQEK